ncbi:MAG: YdcF family protein [Nitrosomonas sp.]|nr:YdcF family protein [Nitrosomonas sp.]
MFLIEKAIALLLAPLGMGLLLGALALVVGVVQWRKLGWVLGCLAVGWLYLWSTPWLSMHARAAIESAHPARLVVDVEVAPVAVVLGGGVASPAPPARFMPDLGRAADRVWFAAQLFHAGKVERIVLSGSVDSRVGGLSEAESMRIFIRDLGVPDAAIHLESTSINTRQNAVHVAQLLNAWGVDRLLLVTSALHMPRAKRQFEAQGLVVFPAATDHEAVGTAWDIRKLMPDSESLDGSGRAIKEWIGLWLSK